MNIQEFISTVDYREYKSVIQVNEKVTIIYTLSNSVFAQKFFVWQDTHPEYSLQRITDEVLAIVKK